MGGTAGNLTLRSHSQALRSTPMQPRCMHTSARALPVPGWGPETRPIQSPDPYQPRVCVDFVQLPKRVGERLACLAPQRAQQRVAAHHRGFDGVRQSRLGG